MLEKALDILDQSHEDECSRINSRIEKNFLSSSRTSSDWGNSQNCNGGELRGSFSGFSQNGGVAGGATEEIP